MKTFKTYLKEFAQRSTSEYVFDTHSANSSSLKIPISTSMFKRIWPDTIRTTVFHTTSLEGLEGIKKLEGGKKSISAFFSMMSRYMETGVASGGDIHVVVEMDADLLVSARDDIWSIVDKTGRRWVEMSWFANAQWGGTGPKFDKVEKDLNTLIKTLVNKHLPKDVTRGEHEYELWSNMKSHLKAGREGGGSRLRLVIKDYFDGVEKVLKKNKEVMSNILYGYAKSKRQTDNAWDEQIVNNIKIKKLHYLPKDEEVEDEEQQENIDAFVEKYKIPAKAWTYSSELEIYTREVVAKEIKK